MWKNKHSRDVSENVYRLGYRLYDGNTFDELPITAGKSTDDAYDIIGSGVYRWSVREPRTLFVSTGLRLVKKVLNAAGSEWESEEALFSFTGRDYFEISIGHNKGNLSNDDRYLLLYGKKNGSDSAWLILVDLHAKTELWTKEYPRGVYRAHPSIDSSIVWGASIDQTGRYIIVNHDDAYYVYDRNMENERKFEDNFGHWDTAIDTNGEAVVVAFTHNPGSLAMYNMKTMTKTVLLDNNYGGGHVSGRNTKRPKENLLMDNDENPQTHYYGLSFG